MTTFVYLGVVFHSKGPREGARKSLQRRMDKARGALFAMMGTCHDMRIFDPVVLGRLFDSLCVSSLLYGVEAWGPEVMLRSRQGVALCGELERLQALFMRMALWLKKSTPLHNMRQELGRVPLALVAVWRCASFWNRLAELPGGHWLHKCWQENPTLGEGAWARQMHNLWMGTVENRGRGELWAGDGLWDVDRCWEHMESLQEADHRRGVERCMEQALEGVDVGSWVRACPDEAREGFKAFKYSRWFQQDMGGQLALHSRHEAGNIRVLAQFRCGSHTLDCELARAEGLRSMRTCRFCASGDVEDELHVMMCTAWQPQRDRFPLLFSGRAYLDTVQAMEVGGDVDTAFWRFMNTMQYEQLDCLCGYLKMVFHERRRLDLG